MSTPAIAARSLYRFFRAGEEETLALRGIDLSVAPGEFVAVVGPSGSGKSTLLACLAGLDEPDGGAVSVAGERMSHRPEPERARLRAQRIGVLLQSGNLLEHLTVAQNVALCRSLADGSSGGRSSRGGSSRGGSPVAGDVVAAVGLHGRATSYPSQLSGGESARAGLAIALANDPVVVLADEPTGELDSGTEEQVLALLAERAHSGVALLVASHSPAVARAADRVITLADGAVAG